MATDRFLDPPEFQAFHDHGNSQSFFDRLDVHPNDVDSLHLNINLGRSQFDVPNTYDQDAGGQAQHQKITTVNVAPAYSRILSSNFLLSANAYVRQDKVTYTPSADPFADQPGTAAQNRELRNIGAKVDFSYSHGVRTTSSSAGRSPPRSSPRISRWASPIRPSTLRVSTRTGARPTTPASRS